MKDIIRKIILAILLIAWMCTIFHYSNQPGSVSSGESRGIVYKIVSHFDSYQNLDIEQQEHVFHVIEVCVRKLAHLSLYIVGGMLFILNLREYIKSSYSVLISFICGIVYAISDEIHQYFVPGRTCMIYDMCLDSLGILIGILIVYCIFVIVKRKRSKEV